MSYKDAFPSRYLKVDDLKGRRHALTIDRIVTEMVGQGADAKQKLVAYFKDRQKGLVLNRINADTIADLVGSDEEGDWAGHRIVLTPAKTDYKGERVGCIRIEEPSAEPSAPPTSASSLLDADFDEGGVQ